MMKTARTILMSSMLALWMPGCSGKSPTPSPSIQVSALDKTIQAEMSKDGLPSLAACIIKGGKIAWQNFYGFSNVAAMQAPTEETAYLLASISKTVTATAVMQLWEKGLLDLDKKFFADSRSNLTRRKQS